mgnify:CR=1 FL=1
MGDWKLLRKLEEDTAREFSHAFLSIWRDSIKDFESQFPAQACFPAPGHVVICFLWTGECDIEFPFTANWKRLYFLSNLPSQSSIIAPKLLRRFIAWIWFWCISIPPFQSLSPLNLISMHLINKKREEDLNTCPCHLISSKHQCEA